MGQSPAKDLDDFGKVGPFGKGLELIEAQLIQADRTLRRMDDERGAEHVVGGFGHHEEAAVGAVGATKLNGPVRSGIEDGLGHDATFPLT
jgi:hypothetical protein